MKDNNILLMEKMFRTLCGIEVDLLTEDKESSIRSKIRNYLRGKKGFGKFPVNLENKERYEGYGSKADALIKEIDEELLLNRYKKAFPRNSELWDYGLGVAQLYWDGRLKPNTTDESYFILALELMVKKDIIGKYDYMFNGKSPQEIIDENAELIKQNSTEVRKEVESQEYGDGSKTDYEIVPVHDFETAKQYSSYVDWCVTQGKSYYNSYTENGMGTFYFLLKDGYKEVSKDNNEEYAYSMIAVCIYPNGGLKNCTSRWNDTPSFLDAKGISKLLGRNMFKALPPRFTKEELNKKIIDEGTVFSKTNNTIVYKLGKQIYFYNRKTNKLKENNLGEIFGVQCYSSKFDKDNCIIIMSDDKMGFINRDGEFVIEPKYDSIWDLDRNNERIVKLGGKWGIIRLNSNGSYSTVIEPKYEDIGVLKGNNERQVKLGGKFGIIRLNSNGSYSTVFEPKYDSIWDLDGNNERKVELDGKLGIITLQQDGTYSEPVWE